MAIESLTYAQIAERLGINAEAARGLVRRHSLPRSTANDGKTLIQVDLSEIAHKKSARKPPEHHPDAGRTAHEEAWARIAALEAELGATKAELAVANDCVGGFRADYERERDRADRLTTLHDTLVSELSGLRTLMIEIRVDTGRIPAERHPDAAEPPRRSRIGRAWGWFLRN
jgi:hypothetical protein